MINVYFEHRKAPKTTCARFWLGCKYGSKGPENFLGNQPKGPNTFTKVMREKHTSVSECSVGNWEHMMKNGLRSTMITVLLDAGLTAAAVVPRIGHKSVDSLKSYNTLLNKTSIRK